MRITEISVQKLFGIFNHKITMNIDERITIIYGKNGIGKTALLRIINALLSLNFYEFSKIYFEELNIKFDNDSYIQVYQTNPSSNKISDKNFIFNYKKQN